MNLATTPDQAEVDDAIVRLVGRWFPLDAVRKATPIGGDAWAACSAAGWWGLGVPVDRGGIGLGGAEQAILFRRIGRHLVPGPHLGTTLAVHVAALSDDDELLSSLLDGRRRGALAVDAGGELLAVDGEEGDLVLVIGEERAVLLDGCTVSPAAGVDLATPIVRVSGGTEAAGCEPGPILDRARLLVAASALGLIDAVTEMSASYAKERVQFGVPIGAFQAVKHRCADMATAAYATESLVDFAAAHVDAGHPAAGLQCAAAHLLAVTSARRSVADNIQNHGAIGFTMEHDAHLYLRRAHLLEHVLGPLEATEQALLAVERHEFE